AMSRCSCAAGHEWQAVRGLGANSGSAMSCPVCGAPATMESLGAPQPIAAVIRKLCENLIAASGTNLAGLVIYGSLARARYRPGRSDINLLVLLHDVSGRV